MKKKINITFNYYCLFAALLLFCSNAFAQIKTVIPADKSGDATLVIGKSTSVNISFDMTTLPAGCIVKSCSLQFVCSAQVEKSGLLLVFKNDGDKQTMIGNATIRSNYTDGNQISIDIPAKPALYPEPGQTYSITLRTGADKPVDAKLYGTSVADKNQGFAPQLIVYYSLNKQTNIEWAMSNANAQHTSQTYMGFRGANPKTYEIHSLTIGKEGDIKPAPLIYKDAVLVVFGNSLFSVSSTSFKVNKLTSGLHEAVDKTIPGIDGLGRFYYSSADYISVIELENKFNYTEEKIKTPSKVDNAITIGADNSLYVPMQSSINGYTPFPQSRLIWSVPMDGKKSALTLNKEGTIAYMVSAQRLGLIAFNTSNGREISFQKITFDMEGYPPVPVIDNGGNVYVCNKLFGATQLYVFKPQLVGLIKTISGNNICTPAVRSAGGIFFMKDGNLTSYDNLAETVVIPFENNEVQSLIADNGDNVYARIKSGPKDKFYSFITNKTNYLTADLPMQADKPMILGADGTLYTATRKNVYIIKPKEFEGDYTLSPADENTNNLAFRAQTINAGSGLLLIGTRVLTAKTSVLFGAATVKKDAEVIVKSGGNIAFGKGFAVVKGGTLVCNTGY
jgi:hypothetical protein